MRCLIGAGLLAFLLAASAPAATYLVHPDGTGDFPTIQAALHAAQGGDVVELTDGVFRGADNRNLSLLGKVLTLRSQSGDPEACILDCEGDSCGVRFETGEGAGSRLEGIGIRRAAMYGAWSAGILCYASPTIENCVTDACLTGLWCGQGAPAVTNCEFRNAEELYFGQSGGGALCG